VNRPRALWTIKLDPRGLKDLEYRVKNMTFVDHTHVTNEGEYLFAPYSVFYVKKTKWSSDPSMPHKITLVAAVDNLGEPEDMPLAPWY